MLSKVKAMKILQYWKMSFGHNLSTIELFWNFCCYTCEVCSTYQIRPNFLLHLLFCTCWEWLLIDASFIPVISCNLLSAISIFPFYDILEFLIQIIVCQADENLRLIRSSLPEAVEACVDAAGHEFDVSRQRTLLRAASYGQAFCRCVWLADAETL